MHKNDISFFLSGGLLNNDSTLSLGGQMSKQEIGQQINNLFDDVTRTESFAGNTDYRCFYMVNNSPNERLKNLSLYINKNLEGCVVSLGLALRSEVQAITVDGFPDKFGHIQFQYTIKHATTTYIQTTREIPFDPNEVNMANRIAAVLNSLDQLEGVQATGHRSSTGYDFLITFGGSSNGRMHELLALVTNTTGSNLTISRATVGGPINSVAPNIGVSNNAPNNVTFFETDNLTPIKIGNFYPGDFIPVWLRRTTAKNTKPVHPDHCSFNLFGEPLPALQSTRNHTTDHKKPTAKMKSNKAHF